MKQKHQAHQRDDQKLFSQLVRLVVDRALDQAGSVVDRHDLNPLG